LWIAPHEMSRKPDRVHVAQLSFFLVNVGIVGDINSGDQAPQPSLLLLVFGRQRVELEAEPFGQRQETVLEVVPGCARRGVVHPKGVGKEIYLVHCEFASLANPGGAAVAPRRLRLRDGAGCRAPLRRGRGQQGKDLFRQSHNCTSTSSSTTPGIRPARVWGLVVTLKG